MLYIYHTYIYTHRYVHIHIQTYRYYPIRVYMVCYPFCGKIHNVNRNGNVLFNNTLDTLYLRLYGVTHMVKDHSDIKLYKQIYISVGKYFYRDKKTKKQWKLLLEQLLSPLGYVAPVCEYSGIFFTFL